MTRSAGSIVRVCADPVLESCGTPPVQHAVRLTSRAGWAPLRTGALVTVAYSPRLPLPAFALVGGSTSAQNGAYWALMVSFADCVRLDESEDRYGC